MQRMNGKYASILAELSMSRKLKDKHTKKLNELELKELPAELRVVGRAILDCDETNEEAMQYMLWADSLSYRKK